MNRIRKRFSRWGGGRLAAALAPARVRVFVVSDVIGDDLASIGSGPCVPDPTTARRDPRGAGAGGPVGAHSAGQPAGWSWRRAGETAETPKPGDQAFARVTLELIASNKLALEAAARRAAELGLATVVAETPLAGEASATGASVAAMLLQHCGPREHPATSRAGRCFIWGGETTVTLGEAPAGLGGSLPGAGAGGGPSPGRRAAGCGAHGRGHRRARWPDRRRRRHRGRDDLAGRRERRPGSRSADLAAHDAYRALDAAGALLKVGLTGTNVMDVVIGVV